MLVYTVQQGKPPVVPSDLTFAAKDHHCTQGPGDKGGSQEIGAYTPKQQVIFDLVLCNQINEDKLWFWWIDSFRCICIDQTVMHPDDAADARSFLQKRTSYPPPFYFPPFFLIIEYQNDTNLVLPTTSSDSDTQSCQLSKASMTKSNLWDNWTELCAGVSSFWAKRQQWFT